MISFVGVYGIKNLWLPERCNICGSKSSSTDCARCFVWTELHWYCLIAKYIRFSIRKYLYGEIPKPRIVP